MVRKWYRNSWKEFNQLKNIDQKFYCSDYHDVELNKCKVKTETSLRFLESKGWINEVDPYGWFQWYFRYVLKYILIFIHFYCILQKGKKNYSKEKAAEYYLLNKETIKKRQKDDRQGKASRKRKSKKLLQEIKGL